VGHLGIRSIVATLGVVVLLVATGCGGPPDPTRGIASLRIAPGAVLLSEEGATRELVVRAYDAQGRERSLEDVSLDWGTTEAGTVGLTVAPDDATRATVEALASPGSSVITVRVSGHPELVATPAPVTVAALTDGTRSIADDRVVFPFTDLPPGATPDAYVPPHVELGGAEATLGSFSETEVGTLFGATGDGDLRSAVVLVDDGGPGPQVGERLVSAGAAGFMGEVASVEARDGYLLVELAPVSLQDVYQRLVFRYDGPDLVDRGLAPPSDARAAEASGLAGAAFADCRFDGNLTGINVQTPLPTLKVTLDPDVAIDTGAGSYRVALTLEAELKMEPGFSLQGGLVGKVVCDLGEPIDKTWALPGPLAAVLGISTELQRVFEASADFSTGPRLEGKLTLGATGKITLGFDTSLAGDASDLNSAEGSLEADMSGVAEWSLLDDLRMQLAGKLVFVGEAGVQLGGLAATKAAEWSGWIPVLGGYVQEAADALNLDLLESEVGPVASAVWESSKRVLNQEGSNGTIALDAVGTLNVQSDALNSILEKFGHGPLKFSLVDIRFPLGTLFRVFDDDEIHAHTESFDGVVQDGPVSARVGETAEFRTTVKYKGAPLIFGSDRPLIRGEVWLGESAYIGPETRLDAAAHEVVFEVEITPEICDDGLSFLAFNDKGGIEFPGYGGFVDIACAAGTSYALHVDPPSGGRIVSEPSGIDCGGDATACDHPFPDGATVALTAIPDAGQAFDAWTGACSGSGPCTVTMDQERTVGALFVPDTGDVIPLGVRIGPMGSLEGVTLVVGPDLAGDGLRSGALASAFADTAGSHVAAFAGADGYALVDLVSGAIVGGNQDLADRGPFFGVAAASQDPPGPDATAMIIAFGLGGWALDVYDPDTGAWSERATPNDVPDPVSYDAVPAGGGPVSDLVAFIQPADGVRFLQWTPDGFGGGDYDPVDVLELDALRYVAAGGELVAAWLADDAATPPAPALVLARDVESRLYLEPRDGSAPTLMPDGLGLDARKLRCASVGVDAWLCGVTVFGDDAVAIVGWDGSGVPDLTDTASVGDGPVGLDVRVLDGGGLAIVSTGFNDDTVSETEVASDGTVVATDTRPVPSGCVQPGHAMYVRDAAGLKLVVTCYGSGSYAVMDSVF
jgi:hypothetical protein